MTPSGVAFSGSYVSVARRNALTDAEVDRVLDAVRQLVADYGGQKPLERATKIKQQIVSRYLATPPMGRPGYAFARQVAAAKGVTAEELLGRTTGGLPPLSAHPDWPSAVAAALEEEPGMEEKIRSVGRVLVPDEVTVTADFVLAMAYSYSRGKPRSGKGPTTRRK